LKKGFEKDIVDAFLQAEKQTEKWKALDSERKEKRKKRKEAIRKIKQFKADEQALEARRADIQAKKEAL
jgi:hypothetical protein